MVTWSFRNVQGWLFREDNTRPIVDIQKHQRSSNYSLHIGQFSKLKPLSSAGASDTYLTPHVSFADFQSQNFGKVLSQLNDTGILKTEERKTESPPSTVAAQAALRVS